MEKETSWSEVTAILSKPQQNNNDNPTAPSMTSQPFKASDYANDGKHHLLLAASGSVATIKLPLILGSLSRHPSLSIRLILTPSATHFLAGQSVEQPTWQSLRQIPNVDDIFLDEDEWTQPWTRGDSILHIELRRWVDLLVIAPLSANTLAKIVGGWADGLLTSVVRAWDTRGVIDGKRKKILAAIAMNTAMWEHPITAKQIRVLEEEWSTEGGAGEATDWFKVLRPQEKELACGDVGSGAMMEWTEIVKVIEAELGLTGG